MHGGSIWALIIMILVSKDEGSTFTFSLPIK